MSRPIIVRVANAERKPWLIRIMTISLILHLLAAPAQIFVVDHFYHGIADWIRYDTQGQILAPNFRYFNFPWPGPTPGDRQRRVGEHRHRGSSWPSSGPTSWPTFMVFSWFSFLGTILFFRAFSLTFAGAGHRRYAYLLFFLPSKIFWTADVSKEAIMMFALGMIVLRRGQVPGPPAGGFPLALVGRAIGVLHPTQRAPAGGGRLHRGHDGGATGQLVRGQPGLDGWRVYLFFGSVLVVSIFLTLHYLHGPGGSLDLNQVSQNNATGCSAAAASATRPVRPAIPTTSTWSCSTRSRSTSTGWANSSPRPRTA